MQQGMELVANQRYFTIWAPRQGGKSTFFKLLSARLRQVGYGVVQVNFESYLHSGPEMPMRYMQREAQKHWGIELPITDVVAWQHVVMDHTEQKWVLIVDEIDGLNRQYLPQFLHTIRTLYHNRKEHALKSVMLVGVSNLAGIMHDHTSPFNIADSFTVPYCSCEEVYALLEQHEAETAALGEPQVFAEVVKAKVWQITGGQPGLVNGIAQQLTLRYPDAPELTMAYYQPVEDWYIKEALEKNTANIIHKASQYRSFIEELIYLEKQVEFLITDPKISFLYTQGVVARDEAGFVTFHVPLYKKRLELAFAVKVNGEEEQFYLNGFDHSMGMNANGLLNWPAVIGAFKDYVRRRGFRYFREKDAQTGKYESIKESAAVYAFEAFIQTLLNEVKGRSYLEAHAGLGNSDLVINIGGQEVIVEAKVYRSPSQYHAGLEQLQRYVKSMHPVEAVYIVFINDGRTVQASITEQNNTKQTLPGGTTLYIYHIFYDTDQAF